MQINNTQKSFIVGLLLGAVVVGGAVFIWMNQKLKAEQRRTEIVEELLDAAIEQIPKPPFPPELR